MDVKLKRLEDELRGKDAIAHELERFLAHIQHERERTIQAIIEQRNAIRINRLRAKGDSAKRAVAIPT